MLKLIDYEVIRGYAPDGAEKEILRELGDYFTSGVPRRLSEAKNAAQNFNTKLLCEHLHALKNSFLNVGARGVAEECQMLEDDTKTVSPGEILDRIEYLNQMFRSVEAEIKEILAENGSH